jgi:tRNA-uridine 2-sulfurtransferase
MEKKQRKKIKRIVVAMSGGIDSSVTAALLKKQNYQVAGAFIDLGQACSLTSKKQAEKIAQFLDIPFYVFDFRKEFKKKIVDYFLSSYQKGITPNPCVACNKQIKFGLLLEKILNLKYDYLATGHYARIKENCLTKAKDKNKDQSYFLWQLSQKQLNHILFPLGNYTKNQVKEIARKFNLPLSKKPESMEVCFIKNKVNSFLADHLKFKPGLILTTTKEKIGQHQGLFFYTIGQRKGIKLNNGPFYVVDKDFKNNFLIVSKKEKDLLKKEIIVKNVNWINGKKPVLPLKVKVQIRYGQKSFSALILKEKNYQLIFNKPKKAIAPGQSVVFYQGEKVLGGGIISK